MAQYYWEADSADEGFLPSNASVTSPWHSWTSLTVEASTADPDFGYALRGYSSVATTARRVAAFSAIGGNSLTQSGVTEIYAVTAASRTYIEHGVIGRISGGDTSETGVGCKYSGGNDDFYFFEYDNASFTAFNSVDYVAATPQCTRIQFDGSTVKMRRWHYGDPEPETWDLTDTTGVTGGGDWGLHAFSYNYAGHYAELLALGFGNNGDTAPTEAVASGTTINAGSKGLTLSALLATVTLSITVNAGVANASITTYPATVSQGTTVDAGVDNLVLTTYAADISSAVEVSAGTANLTLVSYAATISAGTTINAAAATLNITTYPASFPAETNINAAVANLQINTLQASIFLGGARQFDATPARSFDNDYGYFDGPDPLVLILTTSVDSAEGFETPELQLTLEDPTSVPSLESVTVPTQVYHYLYAGAIASEAAFSTDNLLRLYWKPTSSEDSIWTGASAETGSWTSESSITSTWEN